MSKRQKIRKEVMMNRSSVLTIGLGLGFLAALELLHQDRSVVLYEGARHCAVFSRLNV